MEEAHHRRTEELIWEKDVHDHHRTAPVAAHLQTQRRTDQSRQRQSDPDRHRRNGIGQDDADHSVPFGGGVHDPWQDRVHSASSCGRHVRGQESRRGVWLSLGPRSRLHHPFRGLHQS